MVDRAFMPTDARTPSRWHIAMEPVEVFDYKNRNEFIAACQRSISRGMPEVSMPAEPDMYFDEHGPAMRNPIELKYAGVSTWDELERKSIYFTVGCYDRGYHIQSWKRRKDGLWSDEKALELRLSASAGIEGVVDAILEHLKARKDLPGMSFDLHQPRTANGA